MKKSSYYPEYFPFYFLYVFSWNTLGLIAFNVFSITYHSVSGMIG